MHTVVFFSFCFQATDAEVAEIGDLKKDLLVYDTERRALGVSDRRLHKPQVRRVAASMRLVQ